MRYAWLIVLAVVATTGCNQAELKKALAEAKTAEAQKDSLLTEVLETTQFVSDINSELAKAKSLVGQVGEHRSRRPRREEGPRGAAGLARPDQAGHRPARTRARPSWPRPRPGPSSPASGTPASWRRSRPSRRRSTISRPPPSSRRRSTRRRWRRRTPRSPRWPAGWTRSAPRRPARDRNTALTDTVANLTSYKNTVYYAVGTKDELIKRGIVTKEGSKFLVFGGTRLEPARNLDPAAFTAIDKTPADLDPAAADRQEVQDRLPPEPELSRLHRDQGRQGRRHGGDLPARGVLGGVEVPDPGPGLSQR